MQQTPKQIQSEQRSMMWSMILVIAVLFGFQYIYKPKTEVQTEQPTEAVQENFVQPEVVTKTLIRSGQHILVDSPALVGQIAVNGGVFDGLTLKEYKQTIQQDSPNVELLSDRYFALLRWIGRVDLPAEIDDWKVSNAVLSSETPVTLTWKGKGVSLSRQISVDDNYMFTIVDSLTNTSDKAVSVALNGAIGRAIDTVETERSSVHKGFVALIDNRLQESSYTDIEKKQVAYRTKGGWAGMTDKYWQTIFIPDQEQDLEYTAKQSDDTYFVGFQTNPQTIMPGATVTKTTHLFAGAKDLNLINAYQKTLDIPKFELTIDFGWFYFLTKPFLSFLQWLYALVGNMGIAILVFATLLRLALLPIALNT